MSSLMPDRKTAGRGKRIIGAGLLFALAVCLLWDGTSNVLIGRDPATGRKMGCYTRLELLLGATTPGYGRIVELAGAIGLVGYGVFMLWRTRRRPLPV